MGLAVRNNKTEHFTFGDYLTWPEEERWELIDGVAYNMSPAPSPKHQILVGELFNHFKNFLKGKKCQVYLAPFDVRLPQGNEFDNDIETVVQPDLFVLCDNNKIDSKGCKGAPDLIIEILSPSTAGKDVKIKFELYQKVGVKEYWIVDPSNEYIEIYKLNEKGKYNISEKYTGGDVIIVGLFPDLQIELKEIFTGV